MMDAPLHPSKIAKGAVPTPATRQKSCNACVRGKRRCDKKAPRCTRCSTKSLECVYARVPPGAPAGAVLLESDLDLGAGGHQQDHRYQQQGQSQSQNQQATVEDMDVSDFCDLGGMMDMPSLAGSSTAANTNNTASPDTEAGSSSSSSSSISVDMGMEPSHAEPVSGNGATGGGAGTGVRMADFEMQMEPDMSTFSIADLLAQGNPAMDALWNLNDFNALPNHTNPHDKLDILPLSVPPTQPQPQQEMGRPRPMRDIALLEPQCDSCLDPLEIHDPRTRPGFIIQFFSQLHTTFARTRSLPFLHPRLYATQLPPPILAAFCAATAYANRTPETKGWTIKLVADAVRDVHAAAGGTPMEKLARLQALIVLNAIRMLDGDIALRAASEREWHIMRGWLADLTSVRDELEKETPQGQSESRDNPPKSWESWLLLENIRRTIMVAVSLICLVAIIKSELSTVDSVWRQYVHFTASRHLWDAESSLAFYRAWRGKPKFEIRNLDFNEFWQYGTADDLDEFTRVMLTVQAGVDGVEYFVSGETMPYPGPRC